jgi:LPXTG-motif cell wall-anchored protein
MLPETGGMGTVIFVVLGTVAVLGTGVVLFTKKRFAQIAE